MAKIFMMNDSYQHIVIAKSKEQAEKYFRSTFPKGDILPNKYARVEREISPSEFFYFEDYGEMAITDYITAIGITEKDIPTIVCSKE